jgi:hypothetical protein
MAHLNLLTISAVLRAISSPVKSAVLFFLMMAIGPAWADTVSRDWLGGVPESGKLAYEISRKGKPLGFQTLEFSRSPEGELVVDVHIEIDFKLGPIPLFRYLHDNREIWKDGTLLSLKSKTYNNGEDVSVDLRLENGRYVGSGTDFADNLEAPLLSTSYFNPNFVRQKAFISSQDGRLLPTEIETLGPEMLTIRGQQVQATRFSLSGKLQIDIWYSDAGQWMQTEFVRGGNKLVIKQVDPNTLLPRNEWRHP